MSESLGIIDIIVREAVAFAAVGLLIGGIDDLLVDIAFFFWKIWRGPSTLPGMHALPTPSEPGRLAVFVPAWDEVAVIGAMLSAAVARFDHDDYRIYVGLYPNDPGTIDAAKRVADHDPRVRLVIGSRNRSRQAASRRRARSLRRSAWHAIRQIRRRNAQTPAARRD